MFGFYLIVGVEHLSGWVVLVVEWGLLVLWFVC